MERTIIAEKTKSTDHLLQLPQLELAWRRIKLDRPNRCFVNHPHLFEWIESDLAGWLRGILERFREGYIPADCQISYSPKPGWMVRPGAVLHLADELVLNAAIAAFHDVVWKTIGWSQGNPDIAYQFLKNRNDPEWIRSGFRVWNEWREKSLARLEPGVQFVLFADIAAFYENIDLHRLRSDLSSVGFAPWALELLSNLLNRWAHPRGKGIPQGYSGSDILAKIYLAPVDRALRNSGFTHLRYVDDIRIFCRDSLEAKHALLQLNELLRARGLNLQSAKTEIIRIDDARRKIDGIAPLIQTINERLMSELKQVYAGESGYGRLVDIENILRLHPDAPPPEVLERAFTDHFSSPSEEKFDRTLLHYLLTRLGKTRSRVAITYCLGLLARCPDETEAVLRYYSDVGLDETELYSILNYVASPDAIYDYQLYQIVEWFWEHEIFPERLVALCRNWAWDRNRDRWLRSYCIAVLGAAGDESDLEKLETNYGLATTEIEKAECVAAVQRMEHGRRNSFYGRVVNDGNLIERAVNLAKKTK